MPKEIDWPLKVKSILKSELKKRNVSYKQLAEMLGNIGVIDSEANIKNKISRGGFTAVFFIQCLSAIDCHTVRLEDI